MKKGTILEETKRPSKVEEHKHLSFGVMDVCVALKPHWNFERLTVSVCIALSNARWLGFLGECRAHTCQTLTGHTYCGMPIVRPKILPKSVCASTFRTFTCFHTSCSTAGGCSERPCWATMTSMHFSLERIHQLPIRAQMLNPELRVSPMRLTFKMSTTQTV